MSELPLLRLLVQVAWAGRDDATLLLSRDDFVLADRLLARGLITNEGAGTIKITPKGEALIKKLSNSVYRAPCVKAVG